MWRLPQGTATGDVKRDPCPRSVPAILAREKLRAKGFAFCRDDHRLGQHEINIAVVFLRAYERPKRIRTLQQHRFEPPLGGLVHVLLLSPGIEHHGFVEQFDMALCEVRFRHQ